MINKDYIEQFWVGLVEGDGTIIVNQDTRKKILVFRIIIALNNLEENVTMLSIIKANLGGWMRIERKNKYIVWGSSSTKHILLLIKIFDKYPLITSRKICQLNFMKNCLINNNLIYFLDNRDKKYELQSLIIKNQEILVLPNYFPAWLSGFIEAEGCFTKNKNKRGKNYTFRFNIGQNYDEYLIKIIKNYFKSTNKIQLRKNGIYYCIDMYGLEVKINLNNHFLLNPLLGYKSKSYNNWINLIN